MSPMVESERPLYKQPQRRFIDSQEEHNDQEMKDEYQEDEEQEQDEQDSDVDEELEVSVEMIEAHEFMEAEASFILTLCRLKLSKTLTDNSCSGAPHWLRRSAGCRGWASAAGLKCSRRVVQRRPTTWLTRLSCPTDS